MIQDDTGYLAKGNVDQYSISNVKEGMKALIRTEATGDEQLEGVVTFVSPVPAQSTGSGSSDSSSGSATKVQYPVEVKLNVRDSRLRLGMTAETALIRDQKTGVLAIPYDCIVEDAGGNKYVYVEVPEKEDQPKEKKGFFSFLTPEGPKKAETRKVRVETGIETDYYVEIISSEIREGDRVKVPEDPESFAGEEGGAAYASPDREESETFTDDAAEEGGMEDESLENVSAGAGEY